MKADKIITRCLVGSAMLLMLAALLVYFIPAIAILLSIAMIGAIKLAGLVGAGVCVLTIATYCYCKTNPLSLMAQLLCNCCSSINQYLCSNSAQQDKTTIWYKPGHTTINRYQDSYNIGFTKT
jgi:hypothetical protein